MKLSQPKTLVFGGSALVIVFALLTWQMESAARRHRELVLGALAQVNVLTTGDLSGKDVLLGISVQGDEKFRLQIARSLLLLKLTDPEAYFRVTNAIGIIRQDARSATFVTNNPPLVTLSSTSVFYSVTWCAGVLAHEARHVEIARRNGTTNVFLPYYGGRWPPTYKDFRRNESDCLRVQAKVLRHIGAPQSETRYTESLTGTHFDVNHDGRWDLEDYKAQSW